MTKYSKPLQEVQKQEKGSLAMKIKLFLSVLLLVAMVPGVLADAMPAKRMLTVKGKFARHSR